MRPEIKTIEELETYIENVLGIEIEEYSANEIYAVDALGPDLAYFPEAMKQRLVNVAERFLNCEGTVNAAYDEHYRHENAEAWPELDRIQSEFEDGNLFMDVINSVTDDETDDE